MLGSPAPAPSRRSWARMAASSLCSFSARRFGLGALGVQAGLFALPLLGAFDPAAQHGQVRADVRKRGLHVPVRDGLGDGEQLVGAVNLGGGGVRGHGPSFGRTTMVQWSASA